MSRTLITSWKRLSQLTLFFNSRHVQTVATSRRSLSEYKLTTAAMKAWERGRDKETQNVNFDELCTTLSMNIKRTRYAKASHMNKIFDVCMTRDDLKKAERVLQSFRHGFNLPRVSLPITIVRACIRADVPERMLHYIRNKVQFGVFPSNKVYHILMDALLDRGNTKGALTAFDLLCSDELVPNATTYHLATIASLLRSLEALKKKEDDETRTELTEEAESMVLELDRTLEYWEKCRQLKPELGAKTLRNIVDILVAHGQEIKASELLDQVQVENMVPKQVLFNLKVDLAISLGNYSDAITTLKELCNHDNNAWPEVEVPTEELSRLQNVIDESGKKELQLLLAEVIEKLKVSGRLMPSAPNTEPMSHSSNPS